MRLLFIKLKHIGDTLLLTPTLTAARAAYPQATIWVVVRRGCEGILAGCSAVDRILTAAAPEQANRSSWNWWNDWQLLRQLRRQRFDYAFELTDGDRGRWLCGLSAARMRVANIAKGPLPWWWRTRFNCFSKFDWLSRHQVEKDFYTVSDGLELNPPIPSLVFEKSRTQPCQIGLEGSRFAVLHPGTRWKRKRWPEAKWRAVGRFLLGQIPRLVISAGPDPEEVQLAGRLCAELGPGAVSTQGRLSWAQLAGLLYRADVFVGVDTAAMHLAAACQCPSVAIFGPSLVELWSPWQAPHRVVTPRHFQAGHHPREMLAQQTADGVEVEDVIQSCQTWLAQAPRRLIKV